MAEGKTPSKAELELQALAVTLGYPAGETGRLPAALTHKSFANEAEPPEDHNERLEFLGDAVVGLLVGHGLMEAHPDAPEGQLSRLRAGIVNARSLAETAREMGLGRLLRLGRGEELTGGRDKDNLLADACEALIGAVYLDLGLDAASRTVGRLLGERIARAETDIADRDFKTALQELVQARYQTTPTYRLVGEKGPDHDKEFTVELSVGGELLAVGVGRSKKQAERAAAREAMRRLTASPPEE